MGLAYCSSWGIFRPRSFCFAEETGLARVVFCVRDYQRGNSWSAFISYWHLRYSLGGAGFNKTDSFGSPLDDILGFLDRAYSTSCWRADLGLCRALGELGCSPCPSASAKTSTTIKNRFRLFFKFIKVRRNQIKLF